MWGGKGTGRRWSYLCLDIKNTTLALVLYLADSVETGAVVIARELGMLYESAASQEIFEVISCDKMIVFSVDFAWTRVAGGIWRDDRSGTEEEE